MLHLVLQSFCCCKNVGLIIHRIIIPVIKETIEKEFTVRNLPLNKLKYFLNIKFLYFLQSLKKNSFYAKTMNKIKRPPHWQKAV